ncbi:MDR family MFS transporter [Acidithiobacillus thiooxidans]|uniref:MDR family MFS transporter n=1 Tax=Acidithiobacillus thiooxidans TaxID=930 RepID=UPI0029C11D02|nr:MDR family MFS transporter [Acidithiobacillus thiooxidans]MDX5935111.1 MDR family MFS transporter [Acidithiobacillus thiooxidans]
MTQSNRADMQDIKPDTIDNEKNFQLDWSARLMFVAILSSIFLAAMDQTVVSTALPTIARDLNGLAKLPWIVTAYLLTSTVCLPVYGKLGDLLGRKYLLQSAVLLFLAGSALSGLAQNIDELILFRALQGIGGGGLLVTAIASISDFIPVTQRSRYQGLVGAAFGLATLIGPFLGGFIVETLSWRWIFYINVPIGIFALLVIGTAFPKPLRTAEWIMDIWGTVLLITGLSALVLFASVAGPILTWNSPELWLILAIGLDSFAGFFIFEKQHPQPLLPLSFFVGLAMLGSISFLPIYLQDVRHFSPTMSGLELLYLLVGMLSMSIMAGRRISHKQRYREFPIIGALLITVSLGWLSRLGEQTPMWHIDAALVLLGLGLGMTMQVLVLSAQLAIPHKNLGVATSTVTLFRSMGGTLGVAAFGAVFSGLMAGVASSAEHAAMIVQTLRTDFLIAASFSLAAFVGAWFLEDMQILLKKRQDR